MDKQLRASKSAVLVTGWSTRLLILAIIGILFLTLFPFRLTPRASLPGHRLPYLLGGWGEDASSLDAFLNVLLFIPFGFALTEKFREQRKSWLVALIRVLTAGVMFSYGIEFLQLYIPMRDSAWGDVVTNASGSVAGFILFGLFGNEILRGLSAIKKALDELVEWPRAIFIVTLYFAMWYAISIPLQMQTRLSNWSSDSLLVVGNDAPGQLSTAWKGELFRLQVWDRAIRPELARKLTAGENSEDARTGLLAEYDFSKPLQPGDRTTFLPDLSWTSDHTARANPPYLDLDGKSWLISTGAVSNLVAALQKTNQFSIRVVCKPAQIAGADGRIVGIWKRSGPLELRIRQEGANLIFWFSDPLSVGGSDLVWHIQNAFEVNRIRDMLFSYDGSRLFLYVDGEWVTQYRLGPGAALVRVFRSVRTEDLDGYHDIYYFLVFFPGGILLGICTKMIHRQSLASLTFLASAFLVPALLLELVLISVSGRPISVAYILLSALLAGGGSLWINAEG
jgi:glycopeptide antibiotics resistance protein